MKKRITLVSILSLFLASMIGSASWYTNLNKTFEPNFNTSGLTNHLAGLNKTDSFIYDKGTTANGYTNISSDPSYDNEKNTINLGYKGKDLIINGNAYFTHKDAQIKYSESEYTDGNTFNALNAESDYKYFSWINECYNTTNRLYTIKLIGNVTLAEGCTLSIGAFIGRTYMNGFNGPIIQGNFITLDLNGYTLKIEKGATLNAYGYIIDTSLDENGKHKGLIDNYGTIYSSFIVENYNGGGTTVATAAFGTAPFTIYSVPYLSCKTCFHDTSALKCPASLYTYPSSKNFGFGTIYYGGFSKAVIDMIGSSNSLIKINSGSFLIKDSYNDPTLLNTPALYGQNYKSYYEFNGDIDVETMFLNVIINKNDENGNKTGKLASKIINMAEYGFTLPPYIHININSGTTSIGMLIDFLPGSSLYVSSNATIEFKTLTINKNQTLGGNNDITAYGGVRMLSLMTAESSTCYGGLSYGATNAAYNVYRVSEASLNAAGNIDSRATIEGNILVSSTNNNDKHIIGGKINLSDEAKKYIESSDKFDVYAKKYDYYAYISGRDLIYNTSISNIQNAATDKVCASYSILPLVSYGKVVKPKDIYSSFSNDTTYDFSEGVFFSDNKEYAFIPSNTTIANIEGNITQITYDDNKHVIFHNNKSYSFFRNIFVENSNNNLLYVYDNYYGKGYSSMNYHTIDNVNNSVTYTYKYDGTGTTDTVQGTSSRSQTKRYFWESFDENWSGADHQYTEWDYEPENIENGTEIKNTINYKTENVSISNYIFSYNSENLGDIETYNDYLSKSINRRPINISKFTIENKNKYYSVGTIKLSKHIEKKEELTPFTPVNGTIIENKETKPSGLTWTQTRTATLSRNNNKVLEQNWILNRPMYILSTCIKWNSSFKIWVIS